VSVGKWADRYPNTSSPPSLLRSLPAGAVAACTHWKSAACHGTHGEQTSIVAEFNGQTVLGAKPIASHVVDRSPRQQRRSRRAALTCLGLHPGPQHLVQR
jgi:hypothetical protein